MQLVDEAIEQFVRGVEIQQIGVAGHTFLKAGSQAAHSRRQALLVGRQLARQARCIGMGQCPAGEAVEQLGQVLQPRLDGSHHMIGGAAAQALKQPVQRIEASGDTHEFAVQTTEPAVASAHVRVFEYGHAAQAFQAHGFGNEADIAALEGLALATPPQAISDEQRKHAEALVQGVAHGGAGGLREDRGADQGGAENPQGDFQHPPDGGHERPVRVRQRRQADHCRRVAGQHKAVGTEVAITRGTGRADPHPDRQCAEKQFGVLREQGNQRDHYRGPRQRAEEAVKTLGEHLAALRLHDDEHGDHRRTRLRQLQAHGQPEGQEGGDQYLEDVDPGHAVTARPFIKTTAPLKGMQPAQRCRQGSHDVPFSDRGQREWPECSVPGLHHRPAHRGRHPARLPAR
ncbi:hypothetical protein D3C78_848210 [compost metagenome]